MIAKKQFGIRRAKKKKKRKCENQNGRGGHNVSRKWTHKDGLVWCLTKTKPKHRSWGGTANSYHQ